MRPYGRERQMKLRALAAIGLIGHAAVHVLAFLTSWAAVGRAVGFDSGFAFGNPTLATPVERLVVLVWATAIGAITVAGIAGFVVCGVGLLLRQRWWRLATIVCAATSLVAILPWVALIPPLFTSTIVAVDAAILIALALPWGVALGPWVPYLPLPFPIRLRVLPPVRIGPAEDPPAVSERVRALMQGALGELARAAREGRP